MNVIVSNEKIEIQNPTSQIENLIETSLIYTDKGVQYQLRRMDKVPWQKNGKLYAELKKKLNGTLYERQGNTVTIPSAFLYLLKEADPSIQISDQRQQTGHKIVVPWVQRPHTLRPYQEEALDLWLNPTCWRGIANFAMGLGKTLTAIHFIQRYKRNALIVCPSDSIATQFYDQCVAAFGKKKVGFYGGGKKQINDITIGIAASVTRNVDVFKSANFGVVIYDEIHHIAADTFYNIATGLAGVGKVFGLTATDYRSDGKDILITAGCGPVLIRRDIRWGVENKFLAEPYFILTEVDTSGKDFRDNKIKNYKEHVLNNQIMRDRIKTDAEKMIAQGKSVLVLVDEVQHGKELSEQLGVPFATGEDSNSQQYVTQLNSGKIKGLVGTDGRIGEGTDTKNVDVLILANFVASKGPVIQAVGRGLRKTATKDKCLVLDYIPLGSEQLSRHARTRASYYREITEKVKIVKAEK